MSFYGDLVAQFRANPSELRGQNGHGATVKVVHVPPGEECTTPGLATSARITIGAQSPFTPLTTVASFLKLVARTQLRGT
jgi:hypothetical protein